MLKYNSLDFLVVMLYLAKKITVMIITKKAFLIGQQHPLKERVLLFKKARKYLNSFISFIYVYGEFYEKWVNELD